MNFKDRAHTVCYRFPAAPIDTDAAIGTLVGPADCRGKVVAIGHVTTADLTVAASTIGLGSADNSSIYGSHSAAVGIAGTFSVTNQTGKYIPADASAVVWSNGGATAGDGDVLVFVAWEDPRV